MPAATKDTKSTTPKGATTTMYSLTSAVPQTPPSPATQPSSTGEYTDQELLSLVSYYEVSRADLKNVSLLWIIQYAVKEESSIFI